MGPRVQRRDADRDRVLSLASIGSSGKDVRTAVVRFSFISAGCAIIMMDFVSADASAANADPCSHFKWNVSREVAVMRKTAQPITAALRPGPDLPRLKVDILYTLTLAEQNAVTFAVQPAKSRSDAGARAGLVRFRVDAPGHYRISITSGHWLDVIDHGQVVDSLDFQGHTGCERPRKIVEYELPAGRDLTLQLSGSSDSQVVVAITAVIAAAAGKG
jgi:hypothetical protein